MEDGGDIHRGFSISRDSPGKQPVPSTFIHNSECHTDLDFIYHDLLGQSQRVSCVSSSLMLGKASDIWL